MSAELRDRAGVIAPPPLIYLAAILLGAGLERAWRLRVPIDGWGRVSGLLMAASGWILLLLVPVLALIRVGVVAREERYLERKFGGEYVTYRNRVRRWI